MQDGSKKAIIAAFLANSAIAIAKFVGFLLTGAASMLAEAVDAVGSIAIGLLLGVIAVILVIEMKGLLIGEGASPDAINECEHRIRQAVPTARVIYIEPDIERSPSVPTAG